MIGRRRICGAPIRDVLRDCAYVNQFYLETRYPADTYIPVSEQEVQDCIEIADAVLSALADQAGETGNKT